LEIRPWTGEDFDEVFELLDTRSRAVFGISEQQPAYLRQDLEVPGTDSWIARRETRVVGHASLREDQDAFITSVDVEIGDALLSAVELRARERGFARVAITAVPQDEPLYELVQQRGLSLDREIWRMWRTLDGDLPEPQWTDDVTVRAYTDRDGERVHALLDAVYAGWDESYVARSHEGWLAFMTQHDEFDPALWFLVERGDELVACALNWRESRSNGWVKDIVVTETMRGRGLGKALLDHGSLAYAARGAERVGLKVDSNNPTGAAQLYARVGFVTDRRYGIWTHTL
jgi:ribosomal protein S18 acetylase RimI-like enzyme